MSRVDKRSRNPGRPPGSLCEHPRDPKLLMKIIHLREGERLTWREIGKRMGLSHQAPYLVYKRWRDWAYVYGDK